MGGVNQRLFLKPPAAGTNPRVIEPLSRALKPNQSSDRHMLLSPAIVTSSGQSGTQCHAPAALLPGGCTYASMGIPSNL
eukprot:60522-Rhodomonas_salina.1